MDIEYLHNATMFYVTGEHSFWDYMNNILEYGRRETTPVQETIRVSNIVEKLVITRKHWGEDSDCMKQTIDVLVGGRK